MFFDKLRITYTGHEVCRKARSLSNRIVRGRMNFFKSILIMAGLLLCSAGVSAEGISQAAVQDVVNPLMAGVKNLISDGKIRVEASISPESISQITDMAPNALRNFTRAFVEEVPNANPAIEQLGGGVGRGVAAVGPGIVALGNATSQALYPIRHTLLVGTAAAVGIIVAGFLVKRLGEKYIARYMFEPQLIAQSSKKGFFKKLWSWASRAHRNSLELDKHMVISHQLHEELELVAKMTTNVKKHGGQYDNVLLHGAPGTGKTLFAQLLAKHCGMDYAIIPAANVSQFLANGTAVEELNRLFDWAASSKNGTIIFFDEAETFLADRAKLSNTAQNALNLFLARTGTPSSKIMIICATNRLEVLDKAVVSRFGTQIKFDLPDENARRGQLKMHIEKTFAAQTRGSSHVAYDYLKDETALNQIAQQTNGWSGRTIQKFVNRLRQQALAQGQLAINAQLVNYVMDKVQKAL